NGAGPAHRLATNYRAERLAALAKAESRKPKANVGLFRAFLSLRGARRGHRRGGRARRSAHRQRGPAGLLARRAVPSRKERRRRPVPAGAFPRAGGGLAMLLFPAIDLLEGRAVRLQRGERASAKTYNNHPDEQARRFVDAGAQALHVVDLDAAFGGARQLAVIERIARAAGSALLQVGGGIRDLASAQATLEAGAARVVLGTAAVERPALAGEAAARFGAGRVAAGIDVKDGRAATRGWTEAQGPAAPE